jgi:hypothetical protein
VKRLGVWLMISLALVACRPGHVPAPVVGPRGPAGAGFQEAVLQPGPDVSTGRDCTLCVDRGQEGSQPFLSLGADKRGSIQRSLLYFDIAQAGLPADAVVTVAILSLFPNGVFSSPAACAVHAYPIVRDWTEKDATWYYASPKTAWNRPGGDYAASVPVGGALFDNLQQADLRLDLYLDPGLVQGWLRGQPNRGLLLKADDESHGENLISCFSRNYPNDPSKRPVLRILYKNP